MSTRSIIFGTLSILFWVTAAYLALTAWLLQILPCGFSTDTFCDGGPSFCRDALEMLGPLGVLLTAAAIFAGVFVLNRQLQKDPSAGGVA